MGVSLLRGPMYNGLFSFTDVHPLSSFAQDLIDEHTSPSSWHSCLGHPSLQLVFKIISKYQLPATSQPLFQSYFACHAAKSHQHPFSSSHQHSSKPLQLVYSDVWGLAPVLSRDGFKYSITFLDEYTRYIWWFPLIRKSDVLSIFLHFQAIVERLFNYKIISLQSDWGGEY